MCYGSTAIIHLNFFQWGIDFSRQILMSKIGPRAEKVKPPLVDVVFCHFVCECVRYADLRTVLYSEHNFIPDLDVQIKFANIMST